MKRKRLSTPAGEDSRYGLTHRERNKARLDVQALWPMNGRVLPVYRFSPLLSITV